MGHRIPYRLFLKLEHSFPKQSCILNIHRSYIVKRRQRKVVTGLINSRTSALAYSTDIELGSSKGYQYLSELVKDEVLINELEIDELRDDYGNRTCLYPNIQPEDDPNLHLLIHSNAIDEVFDLVKDHYTNQKLVTQAIVTLWDLQVAYFDKLPMPSPNVQENLKTFIQVVKNHPEFWNLVEAVDHSAPLLSNDILASTLLSLRKFQILPWNPMLHSLLCTSLARIQDFSLSALAKWCLAVSLPGQTGRLILPAALPTFEKHLEKSSTLTDYKILSMCFSMLALLVDKTGPTAQTFVNRINQLIENKTLNEDTPLPVLSRILRGLYQVAKNNPSSSSASVRILYMIENSPQMNDPSSVVHFDLIRKSWEAVSEPIGLVQKMEEISCRWLEKMEIQINHLDLLTHVSHNSSLDRKLMLEQHLMRFMETEPLVVIEPHLKQIFRIIRASKISDLRLVDMYWFLVLKSLDRRRSQSDDFFSNLLDSAQWYMFFNNNLGGTYRSKHFENRILDWMNEIVGGDWKQPVINVRYFSRLSAFVLAYGGYPAPEGLLDKLVELEEQLAVQDMFYLSRGIQLGHHWLKRIQRHCSQRDLGDLLSALDRRSTSLLSTQSNSVLGLTTTLLHASLYRNADYPIAKNSVMIHESILRKCETQLDELTGRLCRDIIFFLDRYRLLRLPLVDLIAGYVLKNYNHLGASILYNTLVLHFNLGYLSENLELLAPIVAKCLETNENRVVGLFVLESALALVLMNRLPLKLVNEIFTVQFLDKLDSEVASCYSKTSYPVRIRRTLMELNRSVCIDMPEAGVPWFHEKYCQEQMYSNPPTTTSIHVDIFQCLAQVLNGGQFIKRWTHSPYYHNIDFEVYLDERRQPILPSSRQSEVIDDLHEKVAILPLLPDAFTAYHTNLTGLSLLRHRQLEILGYRVVTVPYYFWNSLALSSPQAKCDYLRKKLFKQRTA